MRFVVGLGNPGRKYVGTPHNVGFEVVDRLAGDRVEDFRRRFKAEYVDVTIGDERVYLIKPQTFMNLSGPAVQNVVSYFGGSPDEMLVVHDDIDLPLKTLRFRARGSSGGHRGVESLLTAFGGRDFARLKIGVGRGGETGVEIDPADHVTSRFSAAERERVNEILDRAASAVEVWITEGIEPAARRFN